MSASKWEDREGYVAVECWVNGKGSLLKGD